MSGSVGVLAEDTKLRVRSVCGVGRGEFWAGYKIVYTECLDLSERWLRIQNSKRNLSVVYVGRILGKILDGP